MRVQVYCCVLKYLLVVTGNHVYNILYGQFQYYSNLFSSTFKVAYKYYYNYVFFIVSLPITLTK